ncbi:MAG TPA: hypothetical protein VND54_00115 [Candidatus Saccharimonadales bacterium]|nr:hypothetical protein [Candidatus Saccharimonadales bacterium]
MPRDRCDTCSWNGTAWTELHPELDAPGDMAWFTMAYDDATRQEVAVGAFAPISRALNPTTAETGRSAGDEARTRDPYLGKVRRPI